MIGGQFCEHNLGLTSDLTLVDHRARLRSHLNKSMELFFYSVIHVGVSIALIASLVLVYFKIRREEFLLYWAGFWACIALVLTNSVLLQPFASSTGAQLALGLLSSTAIFLFPLFLICTGIAVSRTLPPAATRPWIAAAAGMGWVLWLIRVFYPGLSLVVIQVRPLGVVLGLAFLTYQLALKGRPKVGATNPVLVGVTALYLVHNLALFLSAQNIVTIYNPPNYSAEAATVGILLQVALTFVFSYSVIKKTQEVNAEAAEASRRLHSMLGSMGLAGVIVGRNGTVEFCNQWLAETLSVPAKEVVGTRWIDSFVPSRERPDVHAVFDAGFKSGHWPAIHEYSIQSKTRSLSLNWYHTSLLDASGTVIGAASIGVDVSQQRRLEAQIDQARKLETLGRLAGGVAHDFNNHLTAINGFADLILEQGTNDDRVREHVEHIRRSGELGATLTHQLLSFTRKRQTDVRRISVNQTLNKCASILQRLIRENVRLELHLGAEEDFILADSGQLENMVINLVLNANDAIPKQGVVRIRTRQFRGSLPLTGNPEVRDFTVLEVEDTGVGMDEWTKGRIFEPFFTTKVEGKGTGLGLAGVYSAVQEAGGWVGVHSELGKGSTFTVYLPRVERDECAPERESDGAEAKPATGTILLVEDQDMVLRFASLTLKGQGYHVIEASSAAEALLAADSHESISVLVTDVVMPGMSGDELARRLRESRPDLAILFVSGYAFDRAEQLGNLLQPYALLPKPYTSAELLHEVRELLKRQPEVIR
jgi:signal transduction histidine kinase/CheY-like chemotaxis protein